MNEDNTELTGWPGKKFVDLWQKGVWGFDRLRVFGLHGKLAWKILSQNSIWARIIVQKYGSNSVGDSRALRRNSSYLWRALFPHFQNFIEMSQWQVGRGDISFWCSNWGGEVLNMNYNATLNVREGIHNIDQIAHLLSYDQLDRIRLVELERAKITS